MMSDVELDDLGQDILKRGGLTQNIALWKEPGPAGRTFLLDGRSNALVKPIDCVDHAVLEKLGRDVLRPAAVRAILDVVFDALEPAAVKSNVADLTKDLAALDRKIANLAAAVEDGGALGPLVAKLKARQAERDELLAAIGAASAVSQLRVNRHEVERKTLAKLEAWRALVATDGRQFLREVLDGPVRFAAEGNQYRFAGSTTTGQLIAGFLGDSYLSGVPNGIRTRVLALKGPRPGPLDDGDVRKHDCESQP